MTERPSAESAPDNNWRTGFVAIVGRPNVGKSTLLNRLVGQKISIVSRKAQTTRHRVTGILTQDQAQLVFVDTPGFQTRYRNALNRNMNRTVTQALNDVDVVVWVVEAGERLTPEDNEVLRLLPASTPVIVAINKTDLLRDRHRLLPFLAQLGERDRFHAIVPVSADKGHQVDILVKEIIPLLPYGTPLYDEDDVTDRSERFLAAEFLREKLFRLLGDELPYGIAVEIEKFETEGALRRIFAAVVVDRQSHKSMVIGHKGEHIKRIASEARVELEKLFGGPVYLEVWVKVKSGWADDESALRSLGYE